MVHRETFPKPHTQLTAPLIHIGQGWMDYRFDSIFIYFWLLNQSTTWFTSLASGLIYINWMVIIFTKIIYISPFLLKCNCHYKLNGYNFSSDSTTWLWLKFQNVKQKRTVTNIWKPSLSTNGPLAVNISSLGTWSNSK